MAVVTFAAIDIGSYNVTLEIFEMSRRGGVKRIDQVRQSLELGKDAYVTGRISRERLEELCRIIRDFNEVIRGYRVQGVRAVATSAIREVENSLLLMEQIYQKTGVRIELLSNSEQRFLSYKSIASKEEGLFRIIEKGTAILDVGGGSIQISLFDKDALVSTQNIRLGNLRIRERLNALKGKVTNYEMLVEELIRNELLSFKKMYLKDRKIDNVILYGDYFADLIVKANQGKNNTLTREQFLYWYNRMIVQSPMELAVKLGIPLEYASLLLPTAILYKRMIEVVDAETIWMPGASLADGMAYDYAEKKKYIKPFHDFENDILMAAKNIGKRYASSRAHIDAVDMAAMEIFDRTTKMHGMGKRERLLLKIAILLHDCGKYISQNRVADISFDIILATEIIGLSHREREMIAYIVKYNRIPFVDFEELARQSTLDRSEYLTVAKLTAIHRLANALDRSHLQKMESIQVTVRDEEMILRIRTKKDFTLESGLLSDKLDFFEEIFNLKPVLKIKREV